MTERCEMKVLNRCKTLLADGTQTHAELHTFGLNKGAKGYEVTPLDSLCGGRVTLSIEVMMVYIMHFLHLYLNLRFDCETE